MMRKLLIPFIILMISVLVTQPAQAAKSYYAEYFDVQIELQEGGSAIITETVKFHFEGDPFTFAFREISATETDGVTFLEASMDGAPMPRGTNPGQVEVQEGNPLKVTWHFAPTSDAAHVFVVRYQADGVIRKGDADTLVWRAVPEDHEYSIERSTVTLTYPLSATMLGQPALSWDFDAVWEADRVILTAAGIGDDQELLLTARFAPDSLSTMPPQWQTQKEKAAAATAQALPIGFLAGLATLILGSLGFLTYARANARDLNISSMISTATPPADISPAIVGKLTKQQHTFMGAIFDLAQRGVVEVREEKGTWGTTNHILVRIERAVPLKAYEQGLLDALFQRGESQIRMNEVATRVASKNNLFEQPLEEELVQRGWLDLERRQKRTQLSVAGFVMMIISLVILIPTLFSAGISLSDNPGWMPWAAAAAGVGAALFLLSIAVLIYSAAYSILTPAGEEQTARWKGFAEYLKQVSKGQEPAIRTDYFERYLAYAAVFGLGAGWAKYFQGLGGAPLPIWFHATTGSQADFTAMVAVMSASDSSGTAAGSVGGAGASGGGSSGAG